MLMRRLSSSPFVEVNVNDYMWNWTDPLVGVAKKIMPSLVPVDNMGILHRVSIWNNIQHTFERLAVGNAKTSANNVSLFA